MLLVAPSAGLLAAMHAHHLTRLLLVRAGLGLQAVVEDWYFQMYYDDLPIWGFIGKVEKIIPKQGDPLYKYSLFTHMAFEVKYNGDRIIEINLLTDPKHTVDISEDVVNVDVKFTYSVKWSATAVDFKDRLQRYERLPLNPTHVQVNSQKRGYADAGPAACFLAGVTVQQLCRLRLWSSAPE